MPICVSFQVNQGCQKPLSFLKASKKFEKLKHMKIVEKNRVGRVEVGFSRHDM